MCTMDQCLLARVKEGVIDPHEAYMKAASKAFFTPLLQPTGATAGPA